MPTLDDHLRRGALAAPDAPALGWRGRTLTRDDLWRDVSRWCQRLARLGLAAGERVVLDLERGPDWVAAHVALLRLGAVGVPVNPAATAAELGWIAADAEPALSLVSPARETLHAAAGLDRRLVWDGVRADELAPADDKPADAPPRYAPPPDAPRGDDALALLLYTSGTTGQPKGVMLTHGNLAASAACLGEAWELVPGDRLLHSLPLFHVHGLVVALHATLTAGGAVELLPRFEVDAVWRALTSGAVTLFMGVPTMYHRLLGAAPAERVPLEHLRLCTCGSAPLPAERLTAWEQLTGQRILERYGLTEAGMVCGNPLHGERRAGGVGLALPGVETRLADVETGAPTSPGAEGEVQLRGPQVFAGYWKRPEASATAFTPDGWLRTGDLGRIDEAGHLVIAGRLKELVISGGYNVHPPEVEQALSAHPAVHEAAVFGLADVDLGERVVAAVVLEPGATFEPDALLAHCAELLTPYKRPRAVARVEALPRNAMGKLQRGRLADLCGWQD